MKIQRYKRVRRYLNFYKNQFSIEKPYKIIVDGTFCKAALDNKLNLREQLSIYFEGEINFFTTSCVLNELKLLGADVYGALMIAKGYKKVPCKHKTPASGADCLLKIASKNKEKKFFFATQDPLLTETIRDSIVGCPILYINYHTVLLEGPSKISLQAAAGNSENKLNVDSAHRNNLNQLKKSFIDADDDATTKVPKIKRRKFKGPNPLSVKKKQKKKITNVVADSGRTKRKSRHHRRGNKPETKENN